MNLLSKLKNRIEQADIYTFENELKLWIKEELEKHCTIIVTVSRRCSNLVALYLDEIRHSVNFQGKVITENALLVMADSLAKFYIQNRQFLNIIIMDDILVHGRSLNLFLSKFQTIILDYIKKNLNDADMKQVQDDFHKSIHLSIYAINNTPFLLKQEYQWRLQYRYVKDEAGIREISSNISDLLTKKEIANTSYVISAKVSNGHIPQVKCADDWLTMPAIDRFHITNQLHCLKGFENTGVIPSVCSYQKGKYQYYTPYCFLPEISSAQLLTILKKIIAEIEKCGHDLLSRKFIGYFNRIAKHKSRMMVYGQLFELILSQITLRIFLTSCVSTTTQLEYDCEKIASNFDISCQSADFTEMLKELTSIKWTKKDLIDLLSQIRLTKVQFVSKPMQFEEYYETVIHDTELKLYEMSLEHEKSAKELAESFFERKFEPISEKNNTGECELYQFIYMLYANNQECIYEHAIVVIAIITLLINLGFITLKIRAVAGDNGRISFCSTLHITEMCMSIVPQLLGNYFMSFVRFTEFYWWEDDIEQRVQRYFREHICADLNDNCGNKIVQYAKEFAHMIHKYPSIVESMLNWRFLSKTQ